MLDQIVKNEDNQKIGEQTKEAAEVYIYIFILIMLKHFPFQAARKFAARIDYGLQVRIIETKTSKREFCFSQSYN